MIVGLGNDLVETARIARLVERFGERFLARAFTVQERRDAAARGTHEIAALARRFAAKEAAAKALGTGFRNGMTLRDIEVVSGSNGKPQLGFHAQAQRCLLALIPPQHEVRSFVSLSDERNYAWAVVILEAVPTAGRNA